MEYGEAFVGTRAESSKATSENDNDNDYLPNNDQGGKPFAILLFS